MRKCEPQMTKLFHLSVESATYVCQLSKGGDSVKNITDLENQWKQTWRGKKYYNFTRNCREVQGLGALVKFRERSVKILETERLAIVFCFFKVSHSLSTQLDDCYCSSSQQFIILIISSLKILPCKHLETSGQWLQKVPQPLTFCVSP